MITKELRLEAFTPEGLQFPLPGRNVRVSKSFFGGEDMALSFDLDRDPRINYRDVAYGNDVILRRGLNPVFKGEMRSITQGEETLTIGCPGQWIYLDDQNHGETLRIWCENRYKKWLPSGPTAYGGASNVPQKYEMMSDARLYIAPRKNEEFASTYWGCYYYLITTSEDPIKRISWDYKVVLPEFWQFDLLYLGHTGSATPWSVTGVTQSGVKDITLGQPSYYLRFRLCYAAAPPAVYAGETGINCYAQVTNLRLWGQTTESHSSIHVMEAAIDEVAATTPIDASHDLALEEMPVRDTFTDAPGTLLAAHLPDKNELRGPWTAVTGTFDIQANRANCTAPLGAGNQAIAVIDSGIGDGIVALDAVVEAAGTEFLGIVFRFQDIDNYWLWQIERAIGNATLYRRQAAGWNLVAVVACGVEDGYTYHLMVKLRGDRIDCYIGGVWRAGTNNTFLQTATNHGFQSSGVDAVGTRYDNFEVQQMLPLWPLFYEDGESCYGAVKDAASFGDWNYRALGWGVESGGDRAFLRVANRESVRYVIPAQFCRHLSARGETQGAFYTSGWAKYIDEEGITRFTAKYYVHVTNAGLVVNTTATGNDLGSVVYGVDRDHTFDFGRVDAGLAIEYLMQALLEQGHPKVQTSIEVFGPVKDLHRGGALIEPIEMEMGYLVQIPYFRATEAEGAATTDLRDFNTTFLIVGMEVDLETGVAKLIPEGAQEDLSRMIKAARAVVEQDEKSLANKRSRVVGG